jgi:hypothetical protein
MKDSDSQANLRASSGSEESRARALRSGIAATGQRRQVSLAKDSLHEAGAPGARSALSAV